MSESSEISSRLNADPTLADALLLCSRDLDGDLNAEEQQRLAGHQQDERLAAEIQQFRRHSLQLRQTLASWPVADSGPGIIEAVRSHRGASATVRPRFPHARRLATALTGLAAAMVLFFLMRTPEVSPLVASRTGSDAPGAAARGRIVAASVPDAEAATPDADQVRTLALANDPDWQILSVRIDSNDRDEVLQQIQALAVAAGLSLQSVTTGDNTSDDSFGVLLTAAPVGRQQFVDNVARFQHVTSSEWDPAEIAQWNRQELIAAVRSSMLSPTRSELHFGEVFVAVPGAAVAAADRNTLDSEIRFNRAASGTLPENRVATSPAAKSLPSQPTDHQGDSARRPVLVVFEFRHHGKSPPECL